MSSEVELIERIRQLLPLPPRGLVIGPGDDCAAVDGGDGELLLLTCDALVEDRHFHRSHVRPEQLGLRLAAVNLSDVAAMGGEPRWGLLSLMLPPEVAEEWATGLAGGVARALAAHGAAVAGGNLSGTTGGIVADLTLVGRVEPDRVLRRSGARPGDSILVTGSLGAAAAGLRLLAAQPGIDPVDRGRLVEAWIAPQPRLREGRAIALSGLATAMIDVSDGLSHDLGHLCRASGIGAEIDVTALPILDATRRAAAALGTDALDLALGGGEDYELLLTVPAASAAELSRRVSEATGTTMTEIGRTTAASVLRFVDRGGHEVSPPPPGWDHFA